MDIEPGLLRIGLKCFLEFNSVRLFKKYCIILGLRRANMVDGMNIALESGT